MHKMMKWALTALAMGLAGHLQAAAVTYTGTGTGPDGQPVTAAATFTFTGNSLSILLQNTSGANPFQDVPGSTLSGLFFDLTGHPTLTPVSALLAPGSSIIGTQCSIVACLGTSVTNLGGEFGYQQAASFSGGPSGATEGIASSGYLTTGLTGDLGNFNGPNLDDPVSLDGINFGIVSAASGYAPNTGLAKVPVVQDSVIFSLTGVAGLSASNLSHVSFQYGTAFSELNVTGTPTVRGITLVPVPGTLALAGLGLLGLAARLRKRAS